MPSLRFDNVDDYVDVGRDLIASVNDVTITAWVYPQAQATMSVFSEINTNGNEREEVWIETRNARLRIRSFIRTANGASSFDVAGEDSVDLKAWTHIAVVITRPSSGTFIIHYANGVLAPFGSSSSATIFGPLTTVDQNTFIGKKSTSAGGSTRFFNGYIAGVRLYTRGLTQREINTIYKGGHIQSGLKRYWPFFGNADQEIDVSGRGGHATPFGPLKGQNPPIFSFPHLPIR